MRTMYAYVRTGQHLQAETMTTTNKSTARNHGGRGNTYALDEVICLRRRGFSEELIRRHLKSIGMKPARISQLLKQTAGSVS